MSDMENFAENKDGQLTSNIDSPTPDSPSDGTPDATADGQGATRRRKSSAARNTAKTIDSKAQTSADEGSVTKRNTARKRTARKTVEPTSADTEQITTEATEREQTALGGDGISGEAFALDEAASAEAPISINTTEAEADTAESDNALSEASITEEFASAEAPISSDTTETETDAAESDNAKGEASITEELASAEAPLSSDTAEGEADGDSGEIYEISFFDTEARVLTDEVSDGEAGTLAPSSLPDENQLSFFEDEPRVKIPDAPKEIPLFIPKEPKRGAVLRKSQYNPDKPRGVDTVFDFIELFIISLVCVLIVTSFFFRHSKVVGDSMMNTLYDSEHLIISDAFYTPERGDIVVIEDKSINLSGTDEAHYALVKRVIGVAGDHIIVNTQGQVFINGERLTEDYVFIDGTVHSRYVDIIVPEGEIFVLGDHRNNSTDSRYFGTVREDCVIGRVLVRVYPFDRFGAVE